MRNIRDAYDKHINSLTQSNNNETSSISKKKSEQKHELESNKIDKPL